MKKIIFVVATVLIASTFPLGANANGTIERVVATNGDELDQGSGLVAPQAFSADGRYVLVGTSSSQVSSSTQGIYVYDRLTRSFQRVDVSSGGDLPDASAGMAGISSNGKYVVFESSATNLVSNDTNGKTDVFVRDITQGITTRVGLGSGGVEGNQPSYYPSISSDGRYVAFQSNASNLVTEVTTTFGRVYRTDTVTGETILVSVAYDGFNSVSGQGSSSPQISGDGNLVVFNSTQQNLVETGNTSCPPNCTNHVFLRNISQGLTRRVDVSYDGSPVQTQGSNYPTISEDGSTISFESDCSNLVPLDTNGKRDIFVYDVGSQSINRITRKFSGNETSDNSFAPSLSSTGRWLVFSSQDSGIVSNDTNGVLDVFVYDRVYNTFEIEDISNSGAQANIAGATGGAVGISGNGQFVGFYTRASNLVPDDTNNKVDTFIRDRGDYLRPIVTGIPDRSSNINGWYNANVTLDWQATDPNPSSGTPTDPADTQVSTEGQNQLITSGNSCDPAGNCSVGTYTLSLDKTLPIFTSEVSVSPAIRFHSQTSQVSAGVNDTLSGVWRGEFYIDHDPGVGNGYAMTFSPTWGSISGTVPNTIPIGIHKVYVRIQDKAGNWSSVRHEELLILP